CFNLFNSIYCKYCYNKENNEEERRRILYGKCKKCFKACTDHNWCSTCGSQRFDDFKNQIVFKLTDYDLNVNERKVKYKDYDIILCEECSKIFYYNSYCKHCYNKQNNEVERNNMQYKGCNECFKELYGCLSCRFQQVYDEWTSGNKNIDELIHKNQISAC